MVVRCWLLFVVVVVRCCSFVVGWLVGWLVVVVVAVWGCCLCGRCLLAVVDCCGAVFVICCCLSLALFVGRCSLSVVCCRLSLLLCVVVVCC